MQSTCIHRALWTATVLAIASNPVHAQGLDMVNSLFEEVNAVTISVQRGAVTADGKVSGDNLHGAGLEVLIDLASGGVVDLELGLGASYLRGYESTDPTLDFRTSVRALPTVSLYASKDVGLGFSPYAGISFGLVDLWNAQAYDSAGHAWNVEAQTFEFGGSVGAYWTSPAAIGAFVETGFRNREFPSAKWTLPETDSLPREWRSFDLSGYFVQFGIQIRVKEEDQNEVITPPAPSGVWTLERMDGAELPGTLRATTTDTTQVLHGVLRLAPNTATNAEAGSGSWTLDLQLRRETNAGVITFLPESVSGTYTTAEEKATRKHVLTLVPDNDSGGPRQAERLAGRLYLNWNGHVLVFAPGNAPPKEE